jgi:hypothetical protein
MRSVGLLKFFSPHANSFASIVVLDANASRAVCCADYAAETAVKDKMLQQLVLVPRQTFPG